VLAAFTDLGRAGALHEGLQRRLRVVGLLVAQLLDDLVELLVERDLGLRGVGVELGDERRDREAAVRISGARPPP